IHQIMQKIEGGITFHTAMSTAFPKPAPGTAPGPGPMKVPQDRLRRVLGLREVTYVQGRSALARVDRPLACARPAPLGVAGSADGRRFYGTDDAYAYRYHGHRAACVA